MALHSKKRGYRKKACLLTIAMVFAFTAYNVSESAPVQPDSGQALRNAQINERSLPKESQPNLSVGEYTPKPPLVADQGIKVRVDDILITGQDIVKAGELTALYQAQLHRELSFGELSQIAVKITQYFKDRGYLLAQAYLPEQEIAQGSIEIVVVVGRYGDIILKNTSSVVDDTIRQQLRSLQSGAYINNQDLERAVLLAGDLSGANVKLTLAPGKNTGLADCIIEVVDKSGERHGSVAINNWGNRFIGRIQSALNYQIGNPGHVGDALNLSLTGADSEISLTGARYSLPVGEGLTFNAGYSQVRYWLGETYAYLDAHGTIYNKHADLTWALKRSRTANASLQLGYDYKTFRDQIDSMSTITDKSSHAVSFGLSGDSRDSFGDGGVNAYAFQWYDGGLSVQSGTATSPGNWNKTTFNLLRQQTINERLYLQTSLSGQLASTNLDSSERFSLGGAYGVRAYPADEASGDEAWLFSSELYWNIPLKESKQVLRLIGFYDQGVSHIEKYSTDPDNRRALAGAGVGVLWGLPGDYTFKASYAWKIGSSTARSDTDKNGRLWLQGVKYF